MPGTKHCKLRPSEKVPTREEAERLAAEERERAKRERRCPECGNKVLSALIITQKIIYSPPDFWRGLRNACGRPLLPSGAHQFKRSKPVLKILNFF